MNIRNKIKEVLVSYSSIIDLEESKEVVHLLMDLEETFKEGLKNGSN